MRMVSRDVSAQPCSTAGNCPSNLNISAPNEACPGDTIEVTIGGENLGGRTNTVTGGVDPVDIVGSGTVEVKMPDSPGMVTLMISIGSVSASKTIKVIGADDVKITSIGFKIKDGDLTNHLPSKPGKMIGIFSGKRLEFKPITDPANFEGKLGELTWSGEASGEGTTSEIRFPSEGNFDVSLVRGESTNTASVKVVAPPTGPDEVGYVFNYIRNAEFIDKINAIKEVVAALALSAEATRWANSTYPDNDNNPETPNLIADAAKHSYWVMLIKGALGEELAQGVPMAHEVKGMNRGDSGYSIVMDLFNNQVAFDSAPPDDIILEIGATASLLVKLIRCGEEELGRVVNELEEIVGRQVQQFKPFQEKTKELISTGALLQHDSSGLLFPTNIECE